MPNLPPSLVATVMKALAKDPDERFQNAEELRAALEGYGDLEEMTSLVARLPPQSMPRRSPLTSPSGIKSTPPAAIRDQRTHGEWETKPDIKARGRSWLVLPVALVTAVLVGGLYVWRGAELLGRSPVLAAAPPLPAVATSTPAVSASTDTAPAVSTEGTSVTSPASDGTSTGKKKRGAPGPRPTTPSPKPASAPPSAPAPQAADPTSRLPKHL